MQQRTKLVGAILDANNAVPLSDIFTVGADGSMFIKGIKVDYDKATQLKASADMALDSAARSVITEQVAAIAGKRGVSEGDTPEKLYFYRAALWWGMQEQQYLETLAGRR